MQGCGVPMLDENGLSNWTTGAETIAYACLPGYFLEGHSSVTVANCESDRWVPAPPACVRKISISHSFCGSEHSTERSMVKIQ
jgi:hypothetical protein